MTIGGEAVSAPTACNKGIELAGDRRGARGRRRRPRLVVKSWRHRAEDTEQ
jgi:hypothetical protein